MVLNVLLSFFFFLILFFFIFYFLVLLSCNLHDCTFQECEIVVLNVMQDLILQFTCIYIFLHVDSFQNGPVSIPKRCIYLYLCITVSMKSHYLLYVYLQNGKNNKRRRKIVKQINLKNKSGQLQYWQGYYRMILITKPICGKVLINRNFT